MPIAGGVASAGGEVKPSRISCTPSRLHPTDVTVDHAKFKYRFQELFDLLFHARDHFGGFGCANDLPF